MGKVYNNKQRPVKEKKNPTEAGQKNKYHTRIIIAHIRAMSRLG